MPIKRTYASFDDACSTAHAFDVIGDHWASLVVRELLLGPKRYNDLVASLPGVSSAILTARLRQLVRDGVVRRETLPAPSRVAVYELTEWGAQLEPILQDLARWAVTSPNPRGTCLTPDAVILAMRALAPADANPGVRIAFTIWDQRVGRDRAVDYRVTWDESGLTAERGSLPDPDAAVAVESTAWAWLQVGVTDLTSAEDSGDLRIDGDRAAVERLIVAVASSPLLSRLRESAETKNAH